MAKSKTFFICRSCGHEEAKWLGRCPSCSEWNTFSESLRKSGSGKKESDPSFSIPLKAIEAHDGERYDTGIEEMNRVLGQGLMKGSSVLLGGEPGIGKSTLLLQAGASAKVKGRVLYVSGEESSGQIKFRADRLGIDNSNLEVFSSTDIDAVEKVLNKVKPVILIIDSIQALQSRELGAVPGTVNQIKYCCHEIVAWCRERSASVFFAAHVTKEGSIAGPKIIEHMVDTVLHFESATSEIRVLRAIKNRHGSIDEIGLFIMDSNGLNQVTNPASLFMVQRDGDMPPGIAVAPVYEGSRILLVEIQALIVPAKGGFSRVYSDRIDTGKVARIAAVLEKHASLRYSDQDIYVNVAGGIRLKEVGIDLPLAMALYSARTDLSIPSGTSIAGELSLAGEVMPVQHLKRRIKAAREIGFTSVIGPASLREGDNPGESWIKISSIREGIQKVFGS